MVAKALLPELCLALGRQPQNQQIPRRALAWHPVAIPERPPARQLSCCAFDGDVSAALAPTRAQMTERPRAGADWGPAPGTALPKPESSRREVRLARAEHRPGVVPSP